MNKKLEKLVFSEEDFNHHKNEIEEIRSIYYELKKNKRFVKKFNKYQNRILSEKKDLYFNNIIEEQQSTYSKIKNNNKVFNSTSNYGVKFDNNSISILS